MKLAPIQKYQKIINSLITASFPILKNKKINVYEKKDLKYSADTFMAFSYLKIRTHPRLRKYNKQNLIGIFAHELAHLETWEKNKFDYYFIKYFRDILKKYRKFEEEKIDKIVIDKGYARQLYSQRLSRWKDKNPNALKNRWKYMGPKKIKAYAISIDHW